MPKLGVYLRYYQHDSARAALQLASALKANGTSILLVARHVCNSGVSDEWDQKVVFEGLGLPEFWMNKCDSILWATLPDEDDIDFTTSRGIENIILVDWEELSPAAGAIIKSADTLIVPHGCVVKCLTQRWPLEHSNIISPPWCASMPLTQRDCISNRRELIVFVPLYDTQLEKSGNEVFIMIDRLAAACPFAAIVVGVGSGWSQYARSCMKQLRRYHSNIVTVRQPCADHRASLMSTADLVVCPARRESFGLVGLEAISAGTPVFAWDNKPQNEYLVHWKNAILVKGRTNETWFGMPEISENLDRFTDALVKVVADRALLRKLRFSTHARLDNRKKQFLASLASIAQ